MSRRLRILGRVQEDVERIFHWLKRSSPRGASRWYGVLVQAVGKIAESPEIYPSVSESWRWSRDIRQALFKTPRGRIYRIVFELTETEVRLLRIRGPGQSPLRRRDVPAG